MHARRRSSTTEILPYNIFSSSPLEKKKEKINKWKDSNQRSWAYKKKREKKEKKIIYHPLQRDDRENELFQTVRPLILPQIRLLTLEGM